MFNHHHTLRLVAERLDAELRGMVLRAIFTQERNEAILHCRSDRESVFLAVSCDGRLFHLLLRRTFHRARRNSLDLFPAAVGAAILGAAIDPRDRLVRIMLEGGMQFVAAMLPGRSNLFLLDAAGAIIDRFKSHPERIGPPRDAVDDNLSEDRIRERIALRGEEPIDAAARALFPALGGTLLKELLHRAGIAPSLPCAEAGDGRISALIAARESIRADLAHPAPRIYFEGEEAVCFSLIPLERCRDLEERRIDDLFEALERFVRSSGKHRQFLEKKKLFAFLLAKEDSILRHALAATESPGRLEAKALDYERRGALLMALPPGQAREPDRIEAPDLFDGGDKIVSIPLLPKLTLVENAERCYRRSRQCREAARHAGARLEMKRKRLAAVEEASRRLEECFDYSSLLKYIDGNAAMLKSLGMDEKSEERRKPFPYRRFVVFGGYEVWAGKSGANNDELTLHGADKNDLWFHARSIGGSHVVLKSGGRPDDVPKEAIRDAASIAAYYSKQRKAKAVSVSWTLKKYVRKPKGVPTGTVFIEREKVLLVPPKLPDKQESTKEE